MEKSQYTAKRIKSSE